MKSLFLLLCVAVTGCGDYNATVPVCINYPINSTCGTGFFILDNEMITAKHLVGDDTGLTLEILGPGINKKSSNYYTIGNTDSILVIFDETIADDPFTICDTVEINASVDMVGALGRWDDLSIVAAEVASYDDDSITLDVPIASKFSGGPILDVPNKCVIGSISAYNDNETIGVNLTTQLLSTALSSRNTM